MGHRYTLYTLLYISVWAIRVQCMGHKYTLYSVHLSIHQCVGNTGTGCSVWGHRSIGVVSYFKRGNTHIIYKSSRLSVLRWKSRK